MKSSVHLAPTKYLETISRMFKKLYNDEDLADVTLCCKEGTIKAHKIILASCSPYFHRIFTENKRENPILVMHGVSYQLLHNLIELIYKGNVDVYPENLYALYKLAGEFQLSGLSGVLREEIDKDSKSTGNGQRDTRFKGQKRVAVDYKEAYNCHNNDGPEFVAISLDEKATRDNITQNNAASRDTVKPVISAESVKEEVVNAQVSDNSEDAPKLSAWAKKQRKFKCDLCPSSFKRSSHLTRHQLVHTGERPYACHQCDKAFSRHDKLKHHIKKAHEEDNEAYGMELMGHPMVVESPQCTTSPVRTDSPPPFVITHVRSEATTDDAPIPIKRRRGRPRKRPIVEKPLVKRGRGRPRLYPKPETTENENYDLTNLPYGDLYVLTMPAQEQEQERAIMEPFVEIKTDKEEIRVDNNEERSNSKEDGDKNCSDKNDEMKMKEIEDRIGKIGECTISVAHHQK